MQCRACMQSKCHILFDMNILGTEDGKSLYDCFNECTQLDASANDDFPKTLCKKCAQKLQIAYNFRRSALQSNGEFKKLRISQKIKTGTICSSPEELCVLENIEANTDDPLDMSFHDALRALKEPLIEFPTEMFCLKKYPKSSNRSLEETQIEIVRESTPVAAIDTQDAPVHDNDEQLQVIITNDSETDDSSSESETEPIEKVGYTCEICNSTYNIKNELKKHILQQHKSEVICLSCSKIFDMPDELRIHKQLVHETVSPVQCDFCSEKPLLPRNELLKHFQTTHNSRYFKYFPRLRKRRVIDSEDPTTYRCKYCFNIFTTAIDLEEHIRSHVFRCPFCLKNFNRMRTYYIHAKRLHNCSASQFPPTPLVVDEAGDSQDKPIECKACNKSYTNLGSYNTHIKQKHRKRTESNAVQKTTENQIVKIQANKSSIAETKAPDAPTLQNIQSETTSNEDEIVKLNLNRKKNVPIEQAPKELVKEGSSKTTYIPQLKEKKRFLCSFCPRVLCSNVSLASHEKTQHLKLKTDLIKQCPICQKKLNSDYIKRHIKNVHIGERNCICDICGDAYKSFSQLKRHKLLHMTEGHLPCSVCDRKFTEKSALQVHMRGHTGELPFACHICDRQFRIRVHLTYHLQHHANIKKICKVCGKEFKDGTTLRRHSFKHSGKMPYRCTDCGYQTANREYFTSHMLRKHDLKITDDELFLMFKANTGRSPRVKNAEYLKKLAGNLLKSDNSN